MARRIMLVCDSCGSEVSENAGATLRLNFTDSRRGSKLADFCATCAENLPGKSVARRGRKAAAKPAAKTPRTRK